MKKHVIACLAACLFLIVGCEKEDLNNSDKLVPNTLNQAKSNANKVAVCHKGIKEIMISISALEDHLAHGDVQLIDEDGDGYVTLPNDCGYPIDCDDTNPDVQEICATPCELVSSLIATLDINITNIIKEFNEISGAADYLLYTNIEETEFLQFTFFNNPFTGISFKPCGSYYDTSGDGNLFHDCFDAPQYSLTEDQLLECLQYMDDLMMQVNNI